MISAWIRVIRIRFLLASVISVSVGLAITWWSTNDITIVDAILTMCGVLALHASVDLLNDYWDFKRGIDTKTHRTKMSGGSGVLPEGLLKPSQVYAAGIVSLIIGAAIGMYFVATDGIIIGIILAFAVLSIYFYSTKIVNWGLAEVFVGIKGCMIVIGTYFIQTSHINESVILAGIVIGVSSSLVLFITSFPDYDADKAKGRKTLVINLGKQKACSILWVFPVVIYGVTIIAVCFEVFPIFCLLILLTIPLIIRSGLKLKQNYDKLINLIPVMSSTLYFSRITGVLLIVGFLVNTI
uniref:1,4-dihydroxy-2-naphthoate octaprenyltransferase n=1 Tax=uncultured crenarchaeote DeepAnt-EC39 TaxID=247023 RepID=Q6W387_9CREN|nr:1,4-dihydroxy-2-naphthoate octaprenyltransferase [uncultured crenarchaeote DeepAnt-EC39]